MAAILADAKAAVATARGIQPAFLLPSTPLIVWLLAAVALLLPVFSNLTGLISNFTFLQLSQIGRAHV